MKKVVLGVALAGLVLLPACATKVVSGTGSSGVAVAASPSFNADAAKTDADNAVAELEAGASDPTNASPHLVSAAEWIDRAANECDGFYTSSAAHLRHAADLLRAASTDMDIDINMATTEINMATDEIRAATADLTAS